MTKVHVKEAGAVTPSQQVIAKANRTVTKADSEGRAIEVRMLGPVDLFRLSKTLGADAANPTVMTLAMTAASVISIGGELMSGIGSNRDVELVLQILDFHGIAAVNEGLAELQLGQVTVDDAKN